MIFEYVTPGYFKYRDYIEKIVSGENGLMLFRKHESHYTYFIPRGGKQIWKYELSCEFRTVILIRGWRLTEGEVPNRIIQSPVSSRRYPIREHTSAYLAGERRGIKGLWSRSGKR